MGAAAGNEAHAVIPAPAELRGRRAIGGPLGDSIERMNWRELETFSFGDNPSLADQLLALVLEGKKRATCWAVSEGLKGAAVGKSVVALNSEGRPRVVLTTRELVQRRFNDVDDDFAYDEGEGDRSLVYWREAHKRYFTRLGLFEPNMMLWCERFSVEYVIQ